MVTSCRSRDLLLLGALLVCAAACDSSNDEDAAVQAPSQHDAAVITVIGFPGNRGLDAATVLLDAASPDARDAGAMLDGSHRP